MPFVHFKFKSQKDAQRVTFDGTDIQVWELKHEIIKIMNLGDGHDFDLALYHDNSNEEYKDDTERIPQSSLVLARRLPAKISGKGGAARYASGKAPVNARPLTNNASIKTGKAIDINSAQTEEERAAAILRINDQQWQEKQREMANETRVPIMNKPFQKKANVPEGDPPHGYICYRCGKKGHWIQACPTNDDPNFEGRTRIKRTTGIPRSMLRTVEQSEIDQLDEAQRQNLMLDSDGRHVLAKTDDATWAKHLEKVKASEAAQEKAGYGDKDLESRGLECPIDKRLFVDPMKTPCCGKTYCNDCITNALIDSDLTCPGCETENIILEELRPDEEMKEKTKQYEIGKAAEKQGGEGSRSTTPTSPPPLNNANEAAAAPSGNMSPSSSLVDGAAKSNKRSSDDRSGSKAGAGAAPAMKRLKSGERSKDTSEAADSRAFVPATTGGATTLPINSFMPADLTTMMQNMPNMNFPMSNMPMPMSMPGMPFMPMPGMMNPAMMPNFMPQNFNPMAGMNGMNFPNPQYGMFPNNFSNPTMNNFHPVSQYPGANNSHQPNGMQGVPLGPKAQQYPTGPASMSGKFSNQQRPTGKEEDNAYMRQPVNPHRHQNKQKRARPSDYREL